MSEPSATRPLARQDEVAAFRAATSGLLHHYGEELQHGVSDERLAELLALALGSFGGRCGPGQVSVTYQGRGLKIWAAWDHPNHVKDKPIFSGMRTVRMAREVYGIADLGDRQQSLW